MNRRQVVRVDSLAQRTAGSEGCAVESPKAISTEGGGRRLVVNERNV
jgi:hypothetical protein